MNIFLTISIPIQKSSTSTFFLIVETVELLIGGDQFEVRNMPHIFSLSVYLLLFIPTFFIVYQNIIPKYTRQIAVYKIMKNEFKSNKLLLKMCVVY
jgi:hypothetical protein